jgi:hypothetical protein
LDQTSVLDGVVFVDSNLNGAQDGSELGLAGSTVDLYAGSIVSGTPLATTTSGIGGAYSFSGLSSGTYTIVASSVTGYAVKTPATTVTVGCGAKISTPFGEVVLGGKALSKGFWTNKNGQSLYLANALNSHNALTTLNLTNNLGNAWNPTLPSGTNYNDSYKSLATFLNDSTATNMAYMLSAQLAAVQLDVTNSASIKFNLDLTVSHTVYAPTGATLAQNITPAQFATLYADAFAVNNAIGLNKVTALGFVSVGDLIAQADAALAAAPNTIAAGAMRNYQQALKNALDGICNNKNIVVGP